MMNGFTPKVRETGVMTCKKAHFCLNFFYVCPEPVLAKGSCYVKLAPPKGRFFAPLLAGPRQYSSPLPCG